MATHPAHNFTVHTLRLSGPKDIVEEYMPGLTLQSETIRVHLVYNVVHVALWCCADMTRGLAR